MDKDVKEQPAADYQKLLLSLMEEEPTEAEFCGRKVRIGWLHRHTQLKFSHIMLKEQDQGRRNVKLCACVLVNGVFAWFKPLAYSVLWRWFWYVKDLDDTEVLKVLYVAKKKIQYYQSEFITIFSTGMRDAMTGMTTTRKEAEATRAAQAGERRSP